MSSFSRFGLILSILSAATLTAGCPGGSKKAEKNKPQSLEEQWVSRFKKDLAKSEKRFFESRWIQNQNDPFYLHDVLPKLSAIKPPTKAEKAQIDIRREDFEESWPMLTAQLGRTQLIFAITAVLPAYKATVLLTAVNNGIDVENASSIVMFKNLVLKGTVFNTFEQQLDLSPEARQDVVELGNKIAARTLSLITSALSSSISTAAQSQLSLLRNEIRLLNPVAAESAGQGLTAVEVPYIENPLKLWAELKTVYDGIFGVLLDVTRLGSLTQDLDKTHSRKALKSLKSEIAALSPDVQAKIESVGTLRAQEAEILKRLLFSTEKQFSLAKTLTVAE